MQSSKTARGDPFLTKNMGAVERELNLESQLRAQTKENKELLPQLVMAKMDVANKTGLNHRPSWCILLCRLSNAGSNIACVNVCATQNDDPVCKQLLLGIQRHD